MVEPRNTTNIIDRIVRLCSRDFSALLVLALVILVMAETISRYFFNSPLMLVDEFGGYVLVAIVLIGAADTWEAGGHINIDTFIRVLPPGLKRKLRICTMVLALLFTPLLIYTGWELISYAYRYGTRSETLMRIRLIYPQMAVLIGFVLLFFAIFSSLIKTLRTKDTEGKE